MIRKYKKSDYKDVMNMLEIEGEDGLMKKSLIYVLEEENKVMGFISFGALRGFPVLHQLCVSKDHRSMSNFRKLVRSFVKKTAWSAGIFLHAKKDYLNKFIQYYFKAKPYAEVDGVRWYFVEVTHES